MLIQVYVHTWKYCSQNTTTLETRSHVQYDTIRKDHVRWQMRHREEPAGVAEEGSDSHKDALRRESRHASEQGGTEAEPAAAGRRLGAAGRDRTAGEGFGVRPLAAEHQPLMASRTLLKYLGFQTQCVWHPGTCPVIQALRLALQLRVLEKAKSSEVPQQGPAPKRS